MSERAAGILMPISSLPSEYGIGCFSKSAYEFVDWLKKAGQSYWQILPLGPTSYGDSPYQSFSTFAGNPYFISLEALVEEGVLTKAECEAVDWGKAKGSIDYKKIYEGRYPLLRKAYERSKVHENAEYQKFVERTAGGCQIMHYLWQLKTDLTVWNGSCGQMISSCAGDLHGLLP